MQNFVRQWTKKSTGQCVRWFEKSTGQFKKPPAFVHFPVLNTTPACNPPKVKCENHKSRYETTTWSTGRTQGWY